MIIIQCFNEDVSGQSKANPYISAELRKAGISQTGDENLLKDDSSLYGSVIDNTLLVYVTHNHIQ